MRKVSKVHSDYYYVGIIFTSHGRVSSNGYCASLMNVFVFLSLVSGADGKCHSKRN